MPRRAIEGIVKGLVACSHLPRPASDLLNGAMQTEGRYPAPYAWLPLFFIYENAASQQPGIDRLLSHA
jgi:hypothetical protein